MSRERCTFCSTVVSTTADPNDYEGWFVSLADAEKLECDLQAAEDWEFHLRGILNQRCGRLVLCDACRPRAKEQDETRRPDKADVAGGPSVLIQGPVVIGDGQPDLNENVFDIEGVAYQTFLEQGYVGRSCDFPPKLQHIVGHPVAITREGSTLRLKAQVWDAQCVAIARQSKHDKRLELGYGVAGKILEREGNVIKRMEIRSVALLPAGQLSDPRCVVEIVDDA